MVQRILVGCSVSLFLAVAIASCSSSDSGGSAGAPVGGSGGTPATDALDSEPSVTPDVVSEPEAAASLCPEGSWGNVPDTKCHLIAQDCPAGQTCTAVYVNGSAQTRCLSSNNGMKTRGDACGGDSECAAGLKCIFGYCSPFCCKEAVYDICGPGGLCNVNYPADDKGDYNVSICSYLKPCNLWANECPSDQGCHVISTDGSGACIPPAGSKFLAEGEKCVAGNDCGDNQICITPNGSAISTCRYLCAKGTPPTDAGAPDAGPGDGGCPAGQSCLGITDYPAWLGVCIPQGDGG